MPFVHTVPPEHLLPHWPQLLLSVAESTHAPEQYAPPFGHTHWPPWQDEPEAHALSQLPQCASSLFRYTHCPPHAVSGAVQPASPPASAVEPPEPAAPIASAPASCCDDLRLPGAVQPVSSASASGTSPAQGLLGGANTAPVYRARSRTGR